MVKRNSFFTGTGLIVLLLLIVGFSVSAKDLSLKSKYPGAETHANEKDPSHEKEEFEISTFIIDHIKDSHEWHLWTDSEGHHVSIYLPVILYSKYSGLSVFSSSKIAHGHHYKNFYISKEKENKGKVVEETKTGELYTPLDFSITRNVAAMIFAAIFLVLIFVRMGRMYRRNEIMVPKGFFGFLEPMIVFIKTDIAIPNIGEKHYERFMPFLLTVFFFILINNLMGLIPPIIPFGANVTGNIAVTMVLALFTFTITQLNGNAAYWKHIFKTPGVPVWLLPIMIPIEVTGMFIKPFALMIRLFANITAGHIIILSLISIIFIFKSLVFAPVSVAFVLFMSILEILVAFLQAYVFTLLSGLFIGLAVKPDHH